MRSSFNRRSLIPVFLGLAVATPIVLDGLPAYSLNMSLQDIEPTEALGREIGEYLMVFAARCKDELSGPWDQRPR